MSTPNNPPTLEYARKSLTVVRTCMWVIFCICTFAAMVDYSLDLKNRGGLDVQFAYATVSLYYVVAWFLFFSAVDKIFAAVIKVRA